MTRVRSQYKDIDILIKQHIKDEIAYELGKNIEDLIFFSSHTISLEVFKDGTRKLKKKIKNFNMNEIAFLGQEVEKFATKHHLQIDSKSEKYAYLAKALLKAHVIINEAIIEHFLGLYRAAHSWEYLENRAEQIYSLLCDA